LKQGLFLCLGKPKRRARFFDLPVRLTDLFPLESPIFAFSYEGEKPSFWIKGWLFGWKARLGLKSRGIFGDFTPFLIYQK
jgi:hypothetical protein